MTAARLDALVADRLFDGERVHRKLLRLDLDRGRIAAIRPLVPGEPLPPRTLDTTGALLLPGLLNAHVHIARGGMFGPAEPISIPQVVRNL